MPWSRRLPPGVRAANSSSAMARVFDEDVLQARRTPGRIRDHTESACKTLRLQDQRDRSKRLQCPLMTALFLSLDLRSPYWRDRDRDIRDASWRPLWVAYSGAAVLPFWRRAVTPTSGAA